MARTNYLIADALRDAMRGARAVPIGPAGTAADAIRLAVHEELDGALLDVRLRDEDGGLQVAEFLGAKAVPIVLVTGYDFSLHPRLHDLLYLSKPALLSDLVEQATKAFGVAR